MRKVINQNPWFFVAFVDVLTFGLLLVYRLGFGDMVKIARVFPRKTNASPEDALAFFGPPPEIVPDLLDREAAEHEGHR